jgi:hypothetical protein
MTHSPDEEKWIISNRAHILGVLSGALGEMIRNNVERSEVAKDKEDAWIGMYASAHTLAIDEIIRTVPNRLNKQLSPKEAKAVGDEVSKRATEFLKEAVRVMSQRN